MRKMFLLGIAILFTFHINAQIADSVRIIDTRNIDRKPSSYKKTVNFDFKLSNIINLNNASTYSMLLTIAPWEGPTGGPHYQLAFCNEGIYHRLGNKGGTYEDKWLSWSKLIIGDSNGIIQNKLEVNGTIRSKEVKIEATGWSDFVFDKEYNLPTLQAVEQHINDKGHLPDIPSEKEVIEKGINVVEMQAKLLQKIEELTLYVIEQDKKIQELQSKLESKE